MNRYIEKRIKALEQKHAPANSYICYVHPDEDRDEVLAKFRLDNNVKGGIVHVVKFVSRENRP